MFDFGLNQKYFEKRNAIMKLINYIEEEFDLVLINEHYDESLILLTQTCFSSSISTQHYGGGFLKQGQVFRRFAALSPKEQDITGRLFR